MPLRLVQHLVARGLLPEGQAREALHRQASSGGAVDTAVLELAPVAEPDLLEALADVSGLRAVNLADFEPNPQVAPLVPPKIAERWCVVPLSVEGPTLHVACGFPVPRRELEEMGLLLGKQLELWVATEVRVRDWIASVYGVPLAPRVAALLSRLDPARGSAHGAGEPASPPPVEDAAAAEQAAAEALTLQMVEQLARAVAEEPVVVHPRRRAAGGGGDAPDVPEERAVAAAPAPARLAPAAPPAATGPAVTAGTASRGGAAPAARPVTRAAPWLPPSLQAAIARGEDISALLEASPAAAPGLVPVAAPPAPDAARAAANGTASNGTVGTPRPAPAASPAPAARPTGGATPPRPIEALRGAVSPAPAHVSPPAEPQFLVFANSTPGATTPPPPPAPRAGAALPTDVPDWTLPQARAALKEASRDRDRLLDVALRFASRTFEFCGVFAVIRGQAVGWEARGAAPGAPAITEVGIPLDAASIFRTVAITRGSYVGALPQDPLTPGFLEAFGRKGPRAVFLFPVEVRSRLVAILYGDNGPRPVSQRRLAELILFCQELPGAFQELILFRKQRLGDLRLPEEGAAAASAGEAPRAAPAVTGLGWSPFASSERSGPGRAAALPPMTLSQEERPPPDFGAVLRRLTGPDAATRARAMAELARSPEASARELARAFPGPSGWSRMPVTELPEADELGPIPGALSRLGRPAAAALAPLLDSDDADTRYLALLTAGNLPFPELADGVLRGLFDLEPDISSAARAAAAALKQVPRLAAAMRQLRQELASRDALRRSLAARALGALHDRESIDGLINLTASDDEMCAQAAADALREVTRATFGTDTRQWTRWWAEARSRRRAEWLVAALRHREPEVRVASLEELARALGDTLGYDAGAPPEEREPAVRRWEAALSEPLRARRLAHL